jgi:hypothetical protein
MRRIRRPSHATVVAYIALFLVLTGGTAVALSGTNTVFTDDIANDTQPASGGNPAGGLQAADLRPGSVGTSEVTNSSLGLGDLAPAARGARAYGRVATDGDLSRSKNIAGITLGSTGIYCITLANSINPASAVLVVEPDYAGDSTSPNGVDLGVAEWDSDGGCGSQSLLVRTFAYDGDPTDNDNGGGNTQGSQLIASPEAFAFVVP